MKNQREAEGDTLQRVTVRLIEDWERPLFDGLLENEHYLCNPRTVGNTLRYVAELDGSWVALASFSGAALHLKGRERWIGWSPRQRARRLRFVVNNSRFLVLPDRGSMPNLASRALGLCLRALPSDWEARFGHPVFAVESFVDEARYRGTCYRACGFEAAGATEGYARSGRDFYDEHGVPKQLYLRELRKGGRALLRQARWPAALAALEARVAGPCPLRAPASGPLLERFRAELKDVRSGHGLRHTQASVLACAAVAVMMGAGGYQAIEDVCRKLTQRQLRALGCRKDKSSGLYGPPSDSTFHRVLKKVDTAAFDRVIGGWLLERELSEVARIAVDGKTLRGSGRTDGKPLQLLSAVTHRLRLTLGQVAIKEKSNEIPAFPVLLRALPPADRAVVTADAMNCQQESARAVTREKGWDYVFGLKGNQGGILEHAKNLLDRQDPPPLKNRCRPRRGTGGSKAAASCACRPRPRSAACAAAGSSWPCTATASSWGRRSGSRKTRSATMRAASPTGRRRTRGCWTSSAATGRGSRTGRISCATLASARTPAGSRTALRRTRWPRSGISPSACTSLSARGAGRQRPGASRIAAA